MYYGSRREVIANVEFLELRLHEETERGDNETIKMGDQGVGAAAGQCCVGGR